MKKIALLLCALTIVFSSCGSDDDSSSNQDPLIGIWKPYKEFENNIEIPLGDCKEIDRLTFNTDGTSNIKFHESDNDTCVLEEDRNGTWVNEGGNTYTTTLDNLPSATNTSELFFENNTFYVESTEIDGIIDPVTITTRQVFIRVE